MGAWPTVFEKRKTGRPRGPHLGEEVVLEWEDLANRQFQLWVAWARRCLRRRGLLHESPIGVVNDALITILEKCDAAHEEPAFCNDEDKADRRVRLTIHNRVRNIARARQRGKVPAKEFVERSRAPEGRPRAFHVDPLNALMSKEASQLEHDSGDERSRFVLEALHCGPQFTDFGPRGRAVMQEAWHMWKLQQELSDEQIAIELNISRGTVTKHRKRVQAFVSGWVSMRHESAEVTIDDIHVDYQHWFEGGQAAALKFIEENGGGEDDGGQ